VFTSWGKETAKQYTVEKIESILSALEDSKKFGDILRAKGYVNGKDGWVYFDYVPGQSDVRFGAPNVTGRICVIGANVNESALEEVFEL
jgi:hypothetical protein